MRYLILFLLVVGCSSAGKEYRGVTPVRADIEGSVWDVYRQGDMVQAIRVNMEMLPAMDRMLSRAILAIERATGCKVIPNSITGDQALVNARLACDGV